MNKTINFDMDGTIANLYGVDNWLEKLRNEDVTPYIDAQPLCDMNALNAVLLRLKAQGYKICVVSWLAMNASKPYKKAIAQAKKQWLAKYNFPFDKCHMVQYGSTKANAVRRYSNNGILIDDNEKVCKGWKLGATINPATTDIITALQNLSVKGVL